MNKNAKKMVAKNIFFSMPRLVAKVSPPKPKIEPKPVPLC